VVYLEHARRLPFIPLRNVRTLRGAPSHRVEHDRVEQFARDGLGLPGRRRFRKARDAGEKVVEGYV
jgi:hypothetical protein